MMNATEDPLTRARSKDGGAKVRFPPPLVFLGLTCVGVAQQHLIWPLELSLSLWPRIVVGASVAVGGLLMILAARIWFKRTGQHPAPWRPSPELLVRGIYRRTRNPMYVGLTLLELGFGIAIGNGWTAALAPLGLTIVHFLAVRREEAYLTEKFGESYVRYVAAVRRYL